MPGSGDTFFSGGVERGELQVARDPDAKVICPLRRGQLYVEGVTGVDAGGGRRAAECGKGLYSETIPRIATQS
jgi:hypothetical protein